MVCRISVVTRVNSSIKFSPIGMPAMSRMRARTQSIPQTKAILSRNSIAVEMLKDRMRRNSICRCHLSGRERDSAVLRNCRNATPWARAIKR